MHCDKELEVMIQNSVAKGNEDAYYMLTAKREADMDYLSHADIEEIDKSIKEKRICLMAS